MGNSETDVPKNERVRREPNWPGVLFQLYIHASLIYGLYFIAQAKFLTNLYTVFLLLAGLLGTTAGAHRLWAHRSYSANTILRVLLMLCQTLNGCGPIYDWVLDHRIHHRFHGTDDDPYNYKRGFVYAQVGNRMLTPNPRREELVKQIDMSDVEKDKIVMFQKKFYWILTPILTLLLAINAPVEYWGETILNSAMVVGSFRIPVSLHLSWLVNSARTIWGLVPGDRYFSDSNWVFILKKSYWHEYHYTVPWDCLTNEFGSYNSGCSTVFIKIWAAMGWAFDLRTIDSKGIREALELSIDTGKPIDQCINEKGEENLNQRLESDHLDLFEPTSWKPK